MTQYIDKDALVVEIERLFAYRDTLHEQKIIETILYFINSLEVKEVDLDKHQIADIIQNLFPTNQFIESETLLLDKKEAIMFAKHFFELGLKAQKGMYKTE